MVGWHHPLNGHGLEQAPGDGEDQGGLECGSPRSRKESDMTEVAENTCTSVFQDNLLYICKMFCWNLCETCTSI